MPLLFFKKRNVSFIIIVLAILPASVNISFALDIFHTSVYVLHHKNKTAFKNAAYSHLHIEGAGNETISFQVYVPNLKGNISINIDDMKGPGLITKNNFGFYLLSDCQRCGIPDCLLPVKTEGFAPDPFHIKSGGLTIWVDLHIPFRQAPGIYTSSLLLFSNNNKIAHIPVNLKVYSFSLPQKPSLKADLNNYGMGFVKLWGPDIESSRRYRIERAFYSMARKHKMTFNPLPYKSQRGNPHPGMAPVLEGKGDKIKVKDWTDYDKRYEPLFNGSAFKDAIPIDHQYLPFNPEWPSNFSNYMNNRDIYEKEWERIANEFIDHFKEKKWNQVIFQIFMNQRPSKNNRIPWDLDEPKGVESYKALRYYADLTHRVFTGENAQNFKFRIDISHFYCDRHKGNLRKDFRINGGWNILNPVDIWVISRHSMDSPKARAQAMKLKNMGKTIYEYFSGHRMPMITDSLLKAVQYGWNAWLRKEDGILFWNTVKMSSLSDGRNFLIYPGVNYGIDGPVASVRLKAIRRGIQDYEYFKMASKIKPINILIRNHETDKPSDYLKCRKKIARLIEAAGVHRNN